MIKLNKFLKRKPFFFFDITKPFFDHFKFNYKAQGFFYSQKLKMQLFLRATNKDLTENEKLGIKAAFEVIVQRASFF